jgi:hypothetical protein
MKHLPFQSNYRQNFQVVEERRGNTRLFPHTEQLPVLLRALNLEFYGPLPGRLARTDHRADGLRKIALKTAALLFCQFNNAARSDELCLHALASPDLVPRICIIQHITEERSRGIVHRFRFYGGADFFPEIRLSGKRVVFTDHALQRFVARVPNNEGEHLSIFVLAFFGSPIISMPVGDGRAFIVSFHESILAFTYKEAAGEFIITTCLTVNEINSLEAEFPPRAYNLHYEPAFTRPKIRNWLPTSWMKKFYNIWERKVPVPTPTPRKEQSWSTRAQWIFDIESLQRQGAGSRLCFMDNIPGPCTLEVRPTEHEAQYDELQLYKQWDPKQDWDALFAALDQPASND